MKPRSAAFFLPQPGVDSLDLYPALWKAQALQQRGWDCHVYVAGDEPPEAHARRLRAFFGFSGATVRSGWEPKGRYDWLIATNWSSAFTVAAMKTSAQRLYVAADFEPWLYPMGSEVLQAEAAHRLGLPVITEGRWLAYKLAVEQGARCRSVDTPVNLRLFQAPRARREFAVCFRCEPEKPHRAPVIGLEALKRLHLVLPTLKIHLFGSAVPTQLAHPAFCHHGPLPPEQRYELFKSCQVGLCLDATNPGPEIFEMMAAGLPVVGLYGENTLQELPDTAVLLARPAAEAVKQALLTLLGDAPRRERMGEAGASWVAPRSFEAAGDQLEQLLTAIAADAHAFDSPPPYDRQYLVPAFAAHAAPELGSPRQSWELVSYDVWDTVLRRRCHPDEIKLFTARTLILRYADWLKPSLLEPLPLMQLRVQCERAIGARERDAGFDNEYSLPEVFRLWVAQAANRVLKPAEVEQVAQELAQAELAQEKRVVYPDPEFPHWLARLPAGQHMFLSDFYMPAKWIREILDHAGARLPSTAGLSSCDCRLNKRSGRLFQQVQNGLKIRPSAHLHLGDNEFSDVFVPAVSGMRGVHFWNAAEEHCRARLDQWFRARTETARPCLRELTARLRDVPAPEGLAAETREPFALGVRFSLLFFNHVQFIAEQALLGGFPTLFLFTREGEFYQQIYAALAEHDALGVPLPEARVLEVSRLATFAASVRNITTAEFMRVWTLYSTQSMEALVRSLDADPAEFAPLLRRHQLKPDEGVRFPWADARVQRLFQHPDWVSRLQTHCECRRDLLQRYLADRGLTPDTRRALIADIGWRGTIQDNLAAVLPGTELTGIYFGLHRYLNAQPANTRKVAFGPNANLPSGENIHLLEFVSPLEMLSNSPHGSVLRYRVEDGCVRAERERNPSEDVVFEQFTRHFQAGILAAAPLIADFVRCHALTSAEMRPVSLDLLASLVEYPPLPLARAYFGLNHNETFGLGRYEDKKQHLSQREKARKLHAAGDRAEFDRFLHDTTWPQGFARLCGIRHHYNLRCRPERTDIPAADFHAGRAALARAATSLKQQNWDAACTHALESLALWPGQVRGYLALFHAECRRNRRAEAMHYFKVIQALCPKHPSALNELAVLRLLDGQPKEAAALWEELLASQPDYAPAVMNLARLHLRVGRSLAAIECLRIMLEKKPGDREATGLMVAATLENLHSEQQQLTQWTQVLTRQDAANVGGRIRDRLSLLGNLEPSLTSDWLQSCKVSLEPASDTSYLHRGAGEENNTPVAIPTGARARPAKTAALERTTAPEAEGLVLLDAAPQATRRALAELDASQPATALAILDGLPMDRVDGWRRHYGRACALARLGRLGEALAALNQVPAAEFGNPRLRRLARDLHQHATATAARS